LHQEYFHAGRAAIEEKHRTLHSAVNSASENQGKLSNETESQGIGDLIGDPYAGFDCCEMKLHVGEKAELGQFVRAGLHVLASNDIAHAQADCRGDRTRAKLFEPETSTESRWAARPSRAMSRRRNQEEANPSSRASKQASSFPFVG